MNLKENEKLIDANSEQLTYSGRIDFSNPSSPVFIFPGSSVLMSFRGTSLKVLIKNNHSYYDNYLGCIIDGVQKKFILSNDGSMQEIMIADDLKGDKPHEIIIFKRQDGCHEFSFCGFVIPREGEVILPPKKHRRCMEFYGDSAAVGEMVEAKCYPKTLEENHNGKYSNAWNSYAMMTARNLKANVSIIAQSGVALMDNAGCFHAPESIGMESIYDKRHFDPELGKVTDWDFSKYTPHVVVVDIGQYDAVPLDYMKEDKNGDKARLWKRHYKDFILNLRNKYPSAYIVLTTTIMNHHPSWDRAIGQICREINDEKIMHFLYSCNGCGSSSYIGMAEAELMSFELSMFLKGFEPKIWEMQN